MRACAGERLALERLAHRFWYPAYAWIRACGVPATHTTRHCRDFLSQFVTSELPAADDPLAARCREYFLSKLKANLVQGWPAWEGPDFVDFDSAEAERRFAAEPVKLEDETFIRSWSLQILELTLRSLHDEAQNAELFAAMKPFLGFHAPDNGYADAAEKLGMSASAFHFQVFEFRQRYRALLREIVGDTTLHADDVDSELTVLLVGAS